MASVLQQYHQLADRMATQITGSYQSWTDFLTTAARLYKYPYHEQLMIYAQRPEATACAYYELWNKRMGRYVRRGAKGIALIDHSGDAPRLRYVFDVADTYLVLKDGAIVPQVAIEDVEDMVADGTASGGMIPKLRSAAQTVSAGVGSVFIAGWSGPGSLEQILSGKSGTRLSAATN